MSIRIGHGYDIHAFGPGNHVMLGGQRIPFGQGVVAHSDGDVLIHALCDAVLGALALGDIGRHFPPSDPQWKDADSRRLLRHVAAMATARGWRLGNADLTLVAEAPKLGVHFAAIQANLAADLGVAPDRIGLKATTHEGLGALGRGEGLAAHAVVLLEQIA
jgi:2-C-methyl-D-erythritol 2,4-cyclodiphosphate synthase